MLLDWFIEFPVKHSLGQEVTVTEPNYNLYVRTIECGTIAQEDERFVMTIKVQVKTIKEGRIREKILISSVEDNKKQMEVVRRAWHMHSSILKENVLFDQYIGPGDCPSDGC